jgi:hypothetical protein
VTDFITQYEQQLRALRRPHQRRRRRRLAASVVLFGVDATPALAATHPWSPSVGDDVRGHGTTTTALPPAPQIQRLGVLRREQTATDRGPLAEHALAFLDARYQGVETASVRVLRGSGPAAGAVVFPVQAVQRRYPNGQQATTRDGICLFVPDSNGDGGGTQCFGQDVLADQLPAEMGRTLCGLMPDGVAQVRITMYKGPGVTADVEDNFYAVEEPTGASGGPVQLEALDQTGATIKTVKRSDWTG